MNLMKLLIASNKHQFLKSFIQVKGKVTANEAVKYSFENSGVYFLSVAKVF